MSLAPPGALVRLAPLAPDHGDVFEAFPWPTLICDPAGLVVDRNSAAANSLGASIGVPLSSLFCEGDDVDTQAVRAAGGVAAERSVLTRAGWPGQLHLNPLRVGLWSVATVRPSGDDVRRDQALRAHEDRFQALCAHAPAGILCAEAGMRVDYVNDRCAELFGVAPEGMWGFGWLDGLDGEGAVEAAVEAVERAVGGESVGPVALTVRRPDGTRRRVEVRCAPNGTSSGGFVATIEDVTEAWTLAERLERQARNDELTGLGNRRVMVDAIEQAVEAVHAGRPPSALLFIDLDNFKFVNDTFGHNAGDALLVEAARRLLDGVRDVDVVTRFGGDEFVVLLPECERDVTDVADRLVAAMAAPYHIDNRVAVVTASAGIVMVDGTGDAEDVLRNADVAMYQAKRGGKNRAATFSPAERQAAEHHMTVLARLREALEAHPERFSVAYQTICTLDGETLGVEALARWEDPELGAVSPDVFIATAEMSGYASQIGELIRGIAIADAARWRAQGWDGYLSVNVSAEELSDERLANRLTNQLVAAGFPSASLCVEVTETSVMSDPEEARRILDGLATLGVRISIDDFGTGHSSLAYLKRFPVSVLKVDREFVDGVGAQGEDRAICAAIVAFAHAIGVSVIAEGVETEAQVAALRELGVSAGQGWFFSKPAPAEELSAVLDPRPTG